jgi:Xaa-Pro aminopeptidase
MKKDLDRLMAGRELDALVTYGAMRGNSDLVYMSNGCTRISQAIIIKKRDQEPVLVCASIEREEAESSGLQVVDMKRYRWGSIVRDSDDRLAARVELFRRIFADLDLGGRVGFYGRADPGGAWRLLDALDSALPRVTVVGEVDAGVIDAARATKGADEVALIRDVGRRTEKVVAEAVAYLEAQRVDGVQLVDSRGEPITLGAMRRRIAGLIAEQGLEDPEGFIFSQGRDAGVPHNKGQVEAVLTAGQAIVFDIFPRGAGGGYFFDLTRTFCLEYAPPPIEEIYDDVAECLEALVASFQVGEQARRYQQEACAFFEQRGYPTTGSTPGTHVGYVHGLGHGIGLDIHEEPFIVDAAYNQTALQAGHVFTCEPGLYDPGEGYGVRIEDVIWIDEDGMVNDLTTFPKRLVIEV